MECPDCQTENRPEARFCAACGSRLPETEPVMASVTGAATEAPAVEQVPEAQQQAAESGEGADPEALPDSPQDSDHIVAEEAGSTDEAAGKTLPPLPAGTLLADRYEIVEIMSSAPEANVYIALDLARCAVCGFDHNAPGDEYCTDCGAALESPPECQIREQPEPAEPEAVARFTADGRAYFVLAEQTQAEASEPAPPKRIRLRWAAQTHPGQVRAVNEDDVDVHTYAAEGGPTLGLFVVADGVGGQTAGDVASQLAIRVIWDEIRETVWLPELQGEAVLPETIETRIEEAVQAANQVVYRGRTEQANDMGTTVTLALVRDTTAVIANVGDSRTYRWNADGLQQLTVDHSLVQSLIEAGEAEPEEIYTHPQRNIIFRAIGDRPRIEVDTFVEELARGDRLILCSDGLWEMARDGGIDEVLLSEPDPQRACEALVARANLAGGTDNISVVVVQIEGNRTKI